MVKINGVDADLAGVKLSDYLKTAGYESKFIAVEINLEIVPKSAYSETEFKDGDTIEIVNFVGGG